MMERGLDHLVYATPDLDASVEAFPIVAAPEPGIRARLETPNGEIDLS